jgi:hypothetical protein
MRQVRIGGEVRTINACPASFIVYDRAFAGTGHTLDADINAFMAAGNNLVLPMDALMRIEYALEASAVGVDVMPSFDVWVNELPQDALSQFTIKREGEWVADLFNELRDTFFRTEADEDMGAAESQDEA